MLLLSDKKSLSLGGKSNDNLLFVPKFIGVKEALFI